MKLPKRLMQTSLLTILYAATHSSIHAAVIAANSVTATGANSAPSSGSNVANVNNRNGLSAVLTDANLATVTHSTGFSSTNQYLGQGIPSGNPDVTITFNWTATVSDMLNTVAVWNYQQAGQPNRWMTTIDLSWSSDFGASYSSATSFTLTDPGTSAFDADLLDVTTLGISNFTNIRMKVNNANGLDTFNQKVVGLSEVAFQTSPIPEPSSAFLGLIAGGIFTLRRRR